MNSESVAVNFQSVAVGTQVLPSTPSPSLSLSTQNIFIILRGLSHPERKKMRIQLFPDLLQYILFLLFWFSFVGTCPLPKFKRHVQAPPTPLLEVPITHNPDMSHYSLKFEKYSKWIKDQSKSLWESREDHQDLPNNYVSPYLTKFEAKKDDWWMTLDLSRSLRHLLWETIPEWLGGTDSGFE